MSDSNSARTICLQQVCPPGSAAALALRFVPGQAQGGVLACEALLRSMRDIPSSITDPGVALAKLAWWSQEMQQPAGHSQHPARRLLDQQAVAVRAADWQAYLAHLGAVVAEPEFPAMETWQQWLRATGAMEAGLLCGLTPDPDSPIAALGAANLMCGRIGALRSISKGEPRPDWLPLPLLARFQLTASQLSDIGDETPAGELVRYLSQAALDWTVTGLRGVGKQQVNIAEAGALRFVVARALVQDGILRRVAKRPGAVAAAQTGFGDVFRTWRGLRRTLALQP